MKIPVEKVTIQKIMRLSATKPGDLVDLTRREAEAFRGLTRGVKARKRAFTLIELLVVIAIIAILAAMLLPVLNRARQVAWKANCISNFKQLAVCYRMYVDDNNDNLPLNSYGTGAGISSWISYVPNNTGDPGNAQFDVNTLLIRSATIYPYNQNPKIYVCPANNYSLQLSLPGFSPPFRDDFGNLIRTPTVPQTRTCSIEYSMGSGGGNTPPWTDSNGGDTWKTYQKLSSLQATRLAGKIVFVDEASGSVDDGCFALWPMNTVNEWWNIPSSRHLGGGVFSFADCHVEYWKWHGTAVPGAVYQTSGLGNGGPSMPETTPADTSDDLARVQAGGPQYP